jgi:uncharacterized protein (DUF885 family)
VPALKQLIDDFLEHEFEVNPVHASALGLTAYDSLLDDLSGRAMLQRDVDAAAWLRRFEAVPDAGLDAGEVIDRDLALAMLRGRVIMTDWQAWKRDPLVYSSPAVSSVFNLFLHRLRPEAELVDAAVARLEQVPRVFEQGRANLDASLAHPLIVERALSSAKASGRYVRDLLPIEIADGDGRGRLTAAGAMAGDAFDAWSEFLVGFAKEATGDWVFGEERYSRLLRERESLGFDARSLRRMGEAEYDRLDAEMRELCLRIRGTDDWRKVIEEACEDHPLTEDAMRQAYEVWTARARDFLAETGIVTLPDGEQCLVEPSPVFTRPVIGVASYNSPPAFSDSLTGHFFVPFAPDGTPADEVEKRLKANSHGHIPTTSVHEAYPGHHWHLTMRKLSANRLRRVFSTPYFSEGWALYAERVMRERGFFTEPIHELFHLEATIFRAARIIVDTSLHLGEMTFEEAVTFMTTRVPLPEPTARAEVGRYCWWPTQASAYLTGCLEILRIRDRWLEARGLGDVPRAEIEASVLREFHDQLTSSGALPLGLAERAVMTNGTPASR